MAVARAGGAVLTVAWLFAGAVLVAGCFTFDQNFEPLVFSFSGQLPNNPGSVFSTACELFASQPGILTPEFPVGCEYNPGRC